MSTETASIRPAVTTSAQRDAFARDGWIVLPALLGAQDVAALVAAFMAIADGPAIPGLFAPRDTGDPLARWPRVMHPHRRPDLPCGALARRWLIEPRILDAVAELAGEEHLAVQSMFYFKPPGARGQAFHQDDHYLRTRPGRCMAAWIAVDDVDPANGGMSVVPGSHRLPVLPVVSADTTQSFVDHRVELPDGAAPVPAVMRAGDVLFFGGTVIHGSTPNSSATRWRRSLINHYVPISTVAMSHWYRPQIRRDGSELELPVPDGPENGYA